MNIRILGSFVLLFLLANACQLPPQNVEIQANGWETLGIEAKARIRNAHATAFELYAITDDRFYRINADNEVISQIDLDGNVRAEGTPALADNLYARISYNRDDQQILEFRATREPTGIKTFLVDQFAREGDVKLLIDENARTLGVFNRDEDLYLVPATVFGDQKNYTALLLFQVRMSTDFRSFESVELIKRIDLEELNTNDGLVGTLRFIRGNFYVATQGGAYRVTQEGEVKRIFFQWMRDFFAKDDRIYGVGFNSFDFQFSEDDGLNWERINERTELQVIEVTDEMIFTQQFRGAPFKVVSDDLQTTQLIVYPDDFELDALDLYNTVSSFRENYYFSVDNEIYYIPEDKIQTR